MATVIEARRDLHRFLEVRTATAPDFTHDGQRVVYLGDAPGVPEVFSVPAAGGRPERHTFAGRAVRAVRCDPLRDRWACAVEDAAGRTRIHLVEAGGAVEVILDELGEASCVLGCFSDDGSHVAYAANDRDPEDFDVFIRPLGERGELAARRLVRSSGVFLPLAFSPDGRHLLVQEVRGPDDQDLHLVTLETGERRLLTGRAADGPVRHLSAVFTRDGEYLFVRSDRGDDFVRLYRLRLSDLAWHVVDEGGWDVEALAGSHHGPLLVYVRNVAGRSEVHVLDPDGGEDRVLEDLPPGVVTGVGLSHEGRRVAVAVSGDDLPGDVFLAALPDGAPRQVTFSSYAGIPRAALARGEAVRCEAADGLPLTGLLYRPEGEAPAPVVVWVHGGPEGQYRPAFNPLVQYLVNRGFALLAPNVRGSAGFGKGFAALDDVRLRTDAVADLEAWARWLGARTDVDGTRLGLAGAGYGGFLVLSSLADAPGAWRAGVDVVGLADLVSFVGRAPAPVRRMREAEYGSLDEDADFLALVSPVQKVDRIVTPLMVVHDEADPLAPAAAADRIVESLRSRGVAVEQLRFAGSEGRQRLAAWPAVIDFLAHHLGAP